jgi:hypothetical protein
MSSDRSSSQAGSGAGAARAPESTSGEALKTASEAGLSEDRALALLQRGNLAPEVLEALSKNGAAAKSHKVKLAIAVHPRTPRHVSMPLLRQLFTFELMQVALTPAAPADLKKAAEESLINRLETISAGEKIALARRASGNVAAALLLDAEPRVMRTALENPRLTESAVVRAVLRDASPALVHEVCHHCRWPLQKEIRMALLRCQHTPLAKALEFAASLPSTLLREILDVSRLPEEIRAALRRLHEQ